MFELNSYDDEDSIDMEVFELTNYDDDEDNIDTEMCV